MSFQIIRQAKHLLLSGLIASVGLWTVPAQAQVSDAKVNAVVEALRQAAPPNRPNDGMFSQWQVLPGIIPSWTKQCVGRELTPAQFESDATSARNTVACIVGREFKKQLAATNNNETAAVRNVACWWMTGSTACSSGASATYVQRVVGFYQQQGRGNNPPNRQSSSNPTQLAAPSSNIALVSDNQVAAMVEALRLAAPRTANPNDGLYSEWQIRPEIIPRWSKQCVGQELTPVQFESNSQAARSVVSCIMRRELNSQYTAANQNETAAVRRTACWWMSGKPTGCNNGAIAVYVEKVVGFYQQQAQGYIATPPESSTELPEQSTSTETQLGSR